jgi:histidyl-tRNA synthetase
VGGGRYDGLSQLIGGPPAKGFGFALGVERLVMSLPANATDSTASAPVVFIAYIGAAARSHSFALARRLRQAGIRLVVDLEARKLKKALAVANSLAARYSLIVGDDEIASGRYKLRDMTSGEESTLNETELTKLLNG